MAKMDIATASARLTWCIDVVNTRERQQVQGKAWREGQDWWLAARDRAAADLRRFRASPRPGN